MRPTALAARVSRPLKAAELKLTAIAVGVSVLAIACGGLSDAERHYNNGVDLSDQGLHEQAIGEYTQAIELDDEFFDAFFNRGVAYINLGQYENAIADFGQAIHLDHEHSLAFVNRAAAQIRLGNLVAGSADLRTAVDLDPSLCLTFPADRAALASCPAAHILAQLDDDPNLPGEYFPPHLGPDGIADTRDDRIHVAPGVDVPICTEEQIEANQGSSPAEHLCYTSNPPTSGPHGNAPMPFTVLQNPAPKENLVHNMEHGAVIVWYNTTDQSVIDQLADIVNAHINRRHLLVMSLYAGMEPDTIALTAWTRLDKFSVEDFTAKRVEDFIAEHHKRFNPEGF